jgi:hypothetical protein
VKPEPKKKSTRLWAIFVGVGMVLFSSPCVIGMVHDLIVGTDNLAGALIAGGFFSLMMLAGIALAVYGLRKPGKKPFAVTREIERHVLGVARQHGGRLTTSELALYTELSLDECGVVLDHLEMRDVARTHISDDGDIVYVFPHFDDGLDKDQAFDPTRDEVVFERELQEQQRPRQDQRQNQPHFVGSTADDSNEW